VTNVIRNTIRVLRGLYLFRVFIALFGIAVLAAGWSRIAPPDRSSSPAPMAVPLMIPTLVTTVLVLVPGLEHRLGRWYLPTVLALSIVSFSLEYAVAYLNPNSSVRVTLASGREISLFWASTEMMLLILVPCVLAGAAYGMRGAVAASSLAVLIHLGLGVTIGVQGLGLQTFIVLLPLRLGVLYAFPFMTGYLADTWLAEHRASQEANRQLRGYAATIEHLATSRERVRLARAMHDTLAHSLSSLIIQLEAIDTLHKVDPAGAAAQIAKARQAIVDLRSAPVEELGLPGALQRLADDVSRLTGLHVHWQLVGKPVPLLPVQANALYRIAEEALDNVERHAAARQVEVTLDYTNGVTLTVRDDGRGFVAADVDTGRYGLVGMRERAALIGAEVDVRATPSEGTTIVVHAADKWER